MRWFTCAPVPFLGGAAFFSRDSGLLSRGFRSLGVESHAVLCGETKPGQLDELIRTDYQNLESVGWWRKQELDGVVLYSWGLPKFRRVARAIHEAGIFLVLNQDSSGLVSPLNGLRPWLDEQKVLAGVGADGDGWLRLAKLVGRGLTIGLAHTDILRAKHLREGDVIGCVSPMAAKHYRRLCRIYGGEDLESRVRMIPHPVNPVYDYQGERKRRMVVVVGRWDDRHQKRPGLMMSVLEDLLAKDSGVRIQVIGKSTDELESWQESLECGARRRIRLWGVIEPSKIRLMFAEAKVCYCSSAYESFHIVSGEALCSGCSVVAAESPSLPSFPWFCESASGTLALSDERSGHVRALESELREWAAGNRDPRKISRYWKRHLHAPEVAKMILSIAESYKMRR